jgi:hypothetical protein
MTLLPVHEFVVARDQALQALIERRFSHYLNNFFFVHHHHEAGFVAHVRTYLATSGM